MEFPVIENTVSDSTNSSLQSKVSTESDSETPSPIQQISRDSAAYELRKPITPDRLKLPKAFKYPERYRSPTDSVMSPVTKGLLARNRKGGILLPPSINHTKIQDLHVQDVGLSQKEGIEC
ncbi:uncharacterized protein LOC110820162 [Carica papaya]|uniref:uncharacterized protein LOC110820162 n=1 Tax=Carica papaya TaxID=3649 RepID=UPI000B8CDFFA|nr:uncharacterized protein LOC110820162 [Carica papaya]XP_021905280.1 uncharacterized protein LOC110820162 [Carica papaya]